MLEPHLLWRHVERLGPHVDLLVDVHAGDDEEDPGAPGAARQEEAQPEYHSPLILLRVTHILKDCHTSFILSGYSVIFRLTFNFFYTLAQRLFTKTVAYRYNYKISFFALF
jgi:hypothetical protein